MLLLCFLHEYCEVVYLADEIGPGFVGHLFRLDSLALQFVSDLFQRGISTALRMGASVDH